jgi:phenylpropionate dioxygenase-like ring-hydroxylating dioxygenase large terminal subunit
LKSFWYPVLPSDELTPGEVKQTRLFTTPIALYRDEQGDCYALEDACAHRSAQLSKGEVVGNSLRCPYHGWRYSGDGQCQNIPTLEASQPISDTVKVRAYPVIESCGLVWLWPGEAGAATACPEMVSLEQDYFDSPDWQVTNYARELDFRHSLLIENLLDPAHIHFVHAGTMSSPENAGPITPELTITHGGFNNRKPGAYGVFSAFQGPALVTLYFNFGPGSEQTHFFYCIPETETSMRLICRIYTPVTSRRPIENIIAGIDHVLGEDIAVLAAVEQRLREGYPQRGMVVQADRAIMEYQRWCQKNKLGLELKKSQLSVAGK